MSPFVDALKPVATEYLPLAVFVEPKACE